MKWYWMSGQRSPARERMKPQDSKWLLAPSPSLRSSQRAPMRSRLVRPILPFKVIGRLQRNCSRPPGGPASSPPLRALRGGNSTPAAASTAGGPMPESCRITGEPIVPADRINLAPRPRLAHLPAALVLHSAARRPSRITRRVSARGLHLQTGPAQSRPQIGVRRRPAHPVLHRHVHRTEAFLLVAVVVRAQRVSGLAPGSDECLVERVQAYFVARACRQGVPRRHGTRRPRPSRPRHGGSRAGSADSSSPRRPAPPTGRSRRRVRARTPCR